jgi:hypothetical protein
MGKMASQISHCDDSSRDERENASAARPARLCRVAARNHRRLLFFIAYPVYLVVLFGLGIELFLWVRYGGTDVGGKLQDHWRYHYPELTETGVLDVETGPDDGHFDVLLLGGSVLEWTCDEFETELRRRIAEPLRVFNLARSAHTSRDSFWKHSRLADKQFDLVVLYQGINDARMNCFPDSEFRDDYTHCGWYRSFERGLHPDSSKSSQRPAQPGSNRSWRLLGQFDKLISMGEPDPAFVEYGRSIKTAGPFRQNLEAIVRNRSESNQPVLLMTFAYYIPPDYTRERFERGELDYTPDDAAIPVELWGKPEYVAAAIDAHNEQIRQLAESYDNVIFVDQHRLLPRDGQHFVDLCHLSAMGRRKFVEGILSALSERFNVDHGAKPENAS